MLQLIIGYFLMKALGELGIWGVPLAAALFLLMLYVNQESMIYVPELPGAKGRANADNPKRLRSPSEWGMAFEDVRIVTADGVALHAWFVPAPKESLSSADTPATLLFFHGNAGNIGIRLPNIHALHTKCRVNVLAVDYRGYGESESGPTELGQRLGLRAGPSEPGLNLDADAALKWLLSRRDDEGNVDHSKIFLFGRSLGGAVALALAARCGTAGGCELAGCIVENTFTRMADAAAAVMAPLRVLPRGLLHDTMLKSRWDSLGLLQGNVDHGAGAAASCSDGSGSSGGSGSGGSGGSAPGNGLRALPLMFVSGLADEMIPAAQMRALHAAAVTAHEEEAAATTGHAGKSKGEGVPGSSQGWGGRPVLATFPNGKHNETWQEPGYYSALSGFVATQCAARERRDVEQLSEVD